MENRFVLSRRSLARVLGAILAIVATAGPVGGALAQSDRSQSIRVLVGFAPSGGLDVVARLVAQKLTASLAVPVVVENVTGANGNIAAGTVANAMPNGRTLLFTASAHIMNAALDPKLPYDAVNDFAAITMVASGLNVILVHPSLGISTLGQFLELARQKPGTLFYSSAGIGTVSHMGAELFKSFAKIDLTHVPYKGGAPALAAMVSGDVQLGVASLGSAITYVRSGRLVPLAVTSRERTDALPNVPTADSAGVPGYEYTFWNGFMAPAKTSPAIVQRLREHVVASLAAPDLRQRLESDGYKPVGSTPQEFSALMKKELETWTRVVKTAGIKPQ